MKPIHGITQTVELEKQKFKVNVKLKGKVKAAH